MDLRGPVLVELNEILKTSMDRGAGYREGRPLNSLIILLAPNSVDVIAR